MEKYPEIIETNSWQTCILANTMRYYNNRQVVIWGAFDTGKRIKLRLERAGLCDIIFVDSDAQKQNLDGVYASDILRGNAEKYYVVVPLNYKKCIVEELQALGYRKNKDYYYFCDCIKEERGDYYEDYHGNIIYGRHPNLDIMFYGFGSTVRIGSGPWILNSKMNVGSDVRVEIGDECQMDGVCMTVRDNSSLKINHNVHIESIDFKILHDSHAELGSRVTLRKNGKLWVHECADLVIGDRTAIQQNFWINVNQYSEVNIGKDCMMSFDVVIMNNSRHSIFDVVSGANISSSVELCKKSSLTIGDHVWIGYRSMIFEGAHIEAGSLIGADCFIRDHVPNNCIAVGPPFKITRKNIAWARTDNSKKIDDCGLEYVRLTEENQERGDEMIDGCTVGSAGTTEAGEWDL